MLQREIDGLGWPVPVRLLGVNGAGYEAGNDAACAGKDLPWLQETYDDPAWTAWDVTYRDVVILDGRNVPVAVYNLTEHNLADPTAYAELKALLAAAAGAR